MLTNEEIRTKLMDATVRVVSLEGLEGASTRKIGEESGIGGTCIYRYFIDRDDLLRRTFSRENERLCTMLTNYLLEAETKQLGNREKIAEMWNRMVDWLLANPETTRLCRYYFNSPHLAKHVLDEHTQALHKQMNALQTIVPDEVELEAYVYTLFDLAFSFAMRILNSPIEDEKKKALSDYSIKILTSVIK